MRCIELDLGDKEKGHGMAYSHRNRTEIGARLAELQELVELDSEGDFES